MNEKRPTWKVRCDRTLPEAGLSQYRAFINQALAPLPNGQQHPPATIGCLVEQHLRTMLRDYRSVLLDDARASLAEIGRADHLLNLYVTLQDDFETVACVWTFSDPQTAMLFRLGLE